MNIQISKISQHSVLLCKRKLFCVIISSKIHRLIKINSRNCTKTWNLQSKSLLLLGFCHFQGVFGIEDDPEVWGPNSFSKLENEDFRNPWDRLLSQMQAHPRRLLTLAGNFLSLIKNFEPRRRTSLVKQVARLSPSMNRSRREFCNILENKSLSSAWLCYRVYKFWFWFSIKFMVAKWQVEQSWWFGFRFVTASPSTTPRWNPPFRGSRRIGWGLLPSEARACFARREPAVPSKMFDLRIAEAWALKKTYHRVPWGVENEAHRVGNSVAVIELVRINYEPGLVGWKRFLKEQRN